MMLLQERYRMDSKGIDPSRQQLAHKRNSRAWKKKEEALERWSLTYKNTTQNTTKKYQFVSVSKNHPLYELAEHYKRLEIIEVKR